MITVLLSVKEAVTCQQLVSNIAWDELQLRLVGCTSEGQETLKCIEKTLPDIVITDGSVQVMPDIHLERYIETKRSAIKVLLLSDDSKYDKHVLNAKLSKLAAECDTEENTSLEPQYFEQFLNECKPQLREKLLQDLMCGNPIDRDHLVQKCLFLNMQMETRYYVIGVEIDNMKRDFETLQEKQKVFATLYMSRTLAAVLPNIKEVTLLSITEGYYVILIPDYAVRDIVPICNNIRKTFCTYTNLSATFAIGGPPVDMTNLKEAYAKAYEALAYKYLTGSNVVIRYEDIAGTNVGETYLTDTITIQAHIIRAVRTGDSEIIKSLCEEWFSILENCSPTLIKSLIIQFVGNLSVELLKTGTSLTELFGDEDVIIEKVLRFDTIFDVKLWLGQILQYISDYMREKKQKNTFLLAKKAVRYIDEHYMDNINVDVIANAVYLSAGYLMTIFKKEVGVSVVTYLTNKRIERAKELLQENKMKIYDIAEAVGYSNATFFSSTFHKHVGQSPRQFREHYLGEKIKERQETK